MPYSKARRSCAYTMLPRRAKRSQCGKRSRKARESGASSAFERDADAFGLGIDVELLDHDAHRGDPPVGEAERCDTVGEGLDEIDVSRFSDRLDAGDDGLIVDGLGEVVTARDRLIDKELGIDAHPPAQPFLARIDADAARHDEIADENAIALSALVRPR